MKLSRLLALAMFLTAPLASLRAAGDSRIYELRTYIATEGDLNSLMELFDETGYGLIEKHGIQIVGAWVLLEPKTDEDYRKFIILLAHKNRASAKQSWAAFESDPKWQQQLKDGANYIARCDALFLKPTDYSPQPELSKMVAASASPGVFELRTYTTVDGKLDALHARFRDHTISLFRKHGMTNVVYLVPTEGEQGAGNTLIYLLAHADREAQAKSFAGFRADPDWDAARKASEKAGRITIANGGVKSVLLRPLLVRTTK